LARAHGLAQFNQERDDAAFGDGVWFLRAVWQKTETGNAVDAQRGRWSRLKTLEQEAAHAFFFTAPSIRRAPAMAQDDVAAQGIDAFGFALPTNRRRRAVSASPRRANSTTSSSRPARAA
jgi:hypothetical protein